MFLLLALAACAPDLPAAYAGCTVTTLATDADGAFDYEWIATYDEDGRLVADTWDYGDAFEENVVTWEDGCEVHRENRREDATLSSVTTYDSTCDEHGDVTRTDVVATEVIDGVEESWPWGYTYTNDHDEEGRLVHVRIDGDRQQVRTYTWGACDEPVYTTFQNDSGDTGQTTVSCRGDGQSLETFTRWYDAEGAPSMVSRTRRTYDALGRWETRTSDDGEGTDIDLHYTATWERLRDPGPAKVVLRTGAALELTETFTYGFDCPA